jgi:hypothetical protein
VTRILFLLAACSLLLISGLVHGLWTDRWVVSRAVEDGVARLENLPLSVGDWRGAVREAPQEEEIKGTVYADYRAYQFVNRRKGQVVNVLLVCGRPGPVAVHTPDVCLLGAGYQMTTGPEPFTLANGGQQEAALRTATFRKEGAIAGGELRIFWTWNATGSWQAPENPRWSFARAKTLYKLYVIREARAKEAGRAEQDSAVDFLKSYLMELNRALFPAPSVGQ